MRYLVMHKASTEDETGTPPPRELIEGMGKLIGETARAGMFLAGEGLQASSRRYRLTLAGGKCTVTKGPLTGSNELPQSLVLLKVRSTDDALEWARRLLAASGASELELGPLVEPWDLGMIPKPEREVPMRFLAMTKATAASEAGTPPPLPQAAALAKLMAEMRQAGVVPMAETLEPSARAVRVRYRGGQRAVVDGPFTESKELIGGFSMVRMQSLEEVIAWTDRFARILGGTCEVDLRPVAEPDERGEGTRQR